MFETVVPEIVAPRSRRLLIETLPLALAIHALAGGALILGAIWNVAFPQQSPKLYTTYSLLEIPTPPPPPPPPPAAPKRVIQPAVHAVPVKMPLVAPTIIPDEIPVVTAEPVAEAPVVTAAVPADGSVAGGEEGGKKGGEIGGEIGGVIGGITLPKPVMVEIKRDDPLPMRAVAKEFPPYPEYARTRGLEDTLVVHYIIGKDGYVRAVDIIRPPSLADFATTTVSTIRHWRFQPYRDADGEIREVSHELTVEFRLSKRKH
jgi:TonB family protein